MENKIITYPLRLTEDQHEHMIYLRDNYYNVQKFLKHCLKAEAEKVKSRMAQENR